MNVQRKSSVSEALEENCDMTTLSSVGPMCTGNTTANQLDRAGGKTPTYGIEQTDVKPAHTSETEDCIIIENSSVGDLAYPFSTE